MKKILLATLFATTSILTHAENGDTQQFQVKIQINESCKFTSASDVEFSSLDRSTAFAHTAKSELVMKCTLGTPYKVALAGSSRMLNTADAGYGIDYGLYQDTNHQNIWDENNLLSSNGTGVDQTHSVYAEIDSDANVPAGNYVDTVVATVTY